MLSYFHEMRSALERHGGTVEKFVGDAVLAVFGVPEAHEDDALRACRAALDMQARFAVLNEEFERRLGTTDRAADRREHRRGGRGRRVEPRDVRHRRPGQRRRPARAGGRPRRGAARRVGRTGSSATRCAPSRSSRCGRKGRRSPSPPTGSSRPATSGRCRAARARRSPAGRTSCCCSSASSRRSSSDASAGSSRSSASRASASRGSRPSSSRGSAARARVVRGRCLPYGEGITFWPIGEIVRDLAGIVEDHSLAEARAQVEAYVAGAPNARVAAAKIAQLLGLAEGTATAPETEWAIRHFLRARAPRPAADRRGRRHPLGRADTARPARRPPGRDRRRADPRPLPGASGAARAGAELGRCRSPRPARRPGHRSPPREPARELARRRACRASPRHPRGTRCLSRSSSPCSSTRARCSWATASARCRATSRASLCRRACTRCSARDSTASIPRRGPRSPAARSRERSSTRAPWSSCPSRRAARPSHRERSASRRSRPGSLGLGELRRRDGLSLQALLVRDVAYRETAKRLRASLHEQFAHWLERMAGERVTEYGEVVGYHLEQSYRYRLELGTVDDDVRAIGAAAARRLAAAGRRAIARGDVGGRDATCSAGPPSSSRATAASASTCSSTSSSRSR